MGRDVNAWSTWWGSVAEDHRGAELARALDEMGLHLLNEGSDPTFHTVRGGKVYQSHIDVTVCTADLLGTIDDWKVDKGITSSDHNTITFKLTMNKSQQIKQIN